MPNLSDGLCCERLSGPAYRRRKEVVEPMPVALRAASEGCRRCPDAADFQIIQIVCGCCWAWGFVGNALVLSTNPQACARGGLRPAQPARRTVRTCRIGEAGTAPTSTAKSRI